MNKKLPTGKMTLNQLKCRVKAKPDTHGLAGYFETNRLYVNNTIGVTVFGPLYMEKNLAQDFCKEHNLPFTEV